MYTMPETQLKINEYKNISIHDSSNLPVFLLIMNTHPGLNKAKNSILKQNNANMIVNVFSFLVFSTIYYQSGNLITVRII